MTFWIPVAFLAIVSILAFAATFVKEGQSPYRVKGRNNGEKCNVCSGDCGQCG